MIIESERDVTAAVLAELERAPNERFREIMAALVRHLHGFLRETKLSEEEFRSALDYIVALGKHSSASHNEAVLMAGSLGVSALVCLINNAASGTLETDQNLLGPFWRAQAPMTPNGGSIMRSPTPGAPLFVHVSFRDEAGAAVAGAEVDVWHSSPEGFYENQDPAQADMNLRGRFLADETGAISFRTVKPAGYPIPIDGPTGELLHAQGRHNMRPAHLHFLARKEGCKTLITQLYVQDDKFIESDVQFGVTRRLIGNYVRHDDEPAPAADVKGIWYSLDHTFTMQRGAATLPRAPITAKAQGPRPAIPHLA